MELPLGIQSSYKARGFAEPRALPKQADNLTELEKAAVDARQVVIFVDGVRVATARREKDPRKAAEKYRREVKPTGTVTAEVING